MFTFHRIFVLGLALSGSFATLKAAENPAPTLAPVKIADASGKLCFSKLWQFSLVECSLASVETFSRTTTTLSGKAYTSFKGTDNKCLDVNSMKTVNGTEVSRYEVCGLDNQKFLVVDRPDGTVSLKYRLDESKCLDLTTYGAKRLSRSIIFDCDENSVSQRFRLK